MTEHRCDPDVISRSGFGPLTRVRALRSLLAVLDQEQDAEAAFADAVHALGSCRQCWVATLAFLANTTAERLLTLAGPGIVGELDGQLAAALDELAQE